MPFSFLRVALNFFYPLNIQIKLLSCDNIILDNNIRPTVGFMSANFSPKSLSKSGL